MIYFIARILITSEQVNIQYFLGHRALIVGASVSLTVGSKDHQI